MFSWSSQFLQLLKNKKNVHRSSHRRCSVKKGVLKNFTKFTGKHLCQSLFFNTGWLYLKKRLAQVFCCESCEISKNTLLAEHLLKTAYHMSAIKLHTFQFSIWFTEFFFVMDTALKRFPIPKQSSPAFD